MAHIDSRLSLDVSDFSKGLNQASDKLNKFAKGGPSSLGGMVGGLSKLAISFGAVASAAGVALKGIKDAFLATEAQQDAFRRETEAAKSTYDSFLQSLNTGSFAQFISNMGSIRDAAREAYNAVDDLGTMTSFSDIDLQRIQTKRLETQLKIKQGKKSGANVKELQDQLLGYDDELKKIAEEKATLAANAYEKTLAEVTKQGTGGRYNSALAHKYADTWEGYSQVTNETIKKLEKERDALMKSIGITSLDNARRLFASGVTILREEERRALSLDQEISIVKSLKDQESAVLESKKNQVIAEQAHQQALSASLQSMKYLSDEESKVLSISRQIASSQITQNTLVSSPVTIGGKTNTFLPKVSGTMLGNRLDAQYARGSSKTVNDVAVESIANGDYSIASGVSDMQDLGSTSKDTASDLNDAANAVLTIGDTIDGLEESFKNCKNAWEYFSTAIKTSMTIFQALNSLMSLFETTQDVEAITASEDAGAQVADAAAKEANAAASTAAAEASAADATAKATETAATTADATAQTTDATTKAVNTTASTTTAGAAVADATAKGVETAAAAADATMQTADAGSKFMNAHAWIPYVGIALGSAAIGAMVALLATLPKYATGGIVGGNSTDGDKILARLNSGELVLNRSQQRSLVNQLGNSAGGGQVEFRIKDRELVGILGNYYNRQSNKL